MKLSCSQDRSMGTIRQVEIASAVRDRIDAALDDLPSGIQDVLVLRYLAGLSEEETAREAGCTLEAVRRRLGRGLEKIRRYLGRFDCRLSPAALVAAIEQLPTAALPAGFVDRTLDLCTGKRSMPASASRTLNEIDVSLSGDLLRRIVCFGGAMFLWRGRA
jgi:hypothetical protein